MTRCDSRNPSIAWPPPPFSIQQTTNPLGQQTSCSSCLIAPVFKSHPRPCHAPLQHPRRMISALKIGFTYIVKCAGSIRRRGRESQSRVPFRTGDEKSLCWRSVCVCPNEPAGLSNPPEDNDQDPTGSYLSPLSPYLFFFKALRNG